MNKRQRERFERAGGNVIGHSEGAPRGSPRYEWQGERVSKKEAKRILREVDAGRITRPSPVDSLPPYIPAPVSPVVILGSAQPIPFPSDPERVKRERARRKAEQAAKKAKGKARAAKKPTLLDILNKIPGARRFTRFWGPTGILIAAQKVWRNRREHWETYKAWEAQQPRTRAQVIRAPAPGVIPRDTMQPVRRGPPRRYRPILAPVDIPSKGPRTRPVIWRYPQPAPGVVPRARPAARPNVSSSPRPASRPAPSSRTWPAPSSSPAPAPGVAKPPLPSWLTRIVGPALFAGIMAPGRAPRPRIGNISWPGQVAAPLTGFQSYPLPLAQPRPETAKCKCPKPRKRKPGNTCRNPVVSRRKRTSGGRVLITTTRWQKCRA